MTTKDALNTSRRKRRNTPPITLPVLSSQIEIGTVRMRYPGNDPENGRAYPQRYLGNGKWECAEHRFAAADQGLGICVRCGVPRDEHNVVASTDGDDYE